MKQISRRCFLGAAVGIATSRESVPLAGKYSSGRRPVVAYVGTYSSSQGNGRGIHSFSFNSSNGALSPLEITELESSPSCLALAPSGGQLYAANEGAAAPGTNAGSVTAFGVDRGTGRLRFLNTASSGGAGPAHLSVHPAGRQVLVANYAGGSVAVLPIQSDGSLGSATDIKVDRDALGPPRGSSSPLGSFAISGHDSPHAHMIQSDPVGRFVLSTDLGQDRIYIWKFDPAAGKLEPANPSYVVVASGDGPRHFAFHPNARWLFCLQEEGSTLGRFDYDGSRGRLTPRQFVSTLPPGFAGTSFASEVAVSRDGRFVYAANRLHDSIAIFSVGAEGYLARWGEVWTRGDYPRSFGIDPTGNFLLVCNHRSDSVAAFRVDRRQGDLTFTGQFTPVGSPSIIVFLELKSPANA